MQRNCLKLRLATLAVAIALLAGSAGVATAQPPYPATINGYHTPGAIPPAPVAGPYGPGVVYYTGPAAPAPLAPLVYTQKYSFYSTPTVTYYPPQFSSPIPIMPSANAYYETDLFAPYNYTSRYQSEALTPLLYGNTTYKSTYPYYSPRFFRY